MCGNYTISSYSPNDGQGSPPRVRELRAEQQSSRADGGITPACAGITAPLVRFNAYAKDHPRVCGNYIHLPWILYADSGSPPRVRELQVMWEHYMLNGGITPACAGITSSDG